MRGPDPRSIPVVCTVRQHLPTGTPTCWVHLRVPAEFLAGRPERCHNRFRGSVVRVQGDGVERDRGGAGRAATRAGGLRLAVLGDSLAAGTGATRAADGLGPRLAATLTDAGAPASAHVVAVPGAVSPDLGPQGVRAAGGPPDVALVVVGGNDLIRGVPLADSVSHLRRAVADLRGAGADVLVVPVPDLSVVAHVPPQLRDLVRTASSGLRAAQTGAVLAAGGRVVDPSPATTRRFATDAGLFSADRFHPSSAGYAVLAVDLLPALRALVDQRTDAPGAGTGD